MSHTYRDKGCDTGTEDVTPTQGQRMSHTYRDKGCHTDTGTEDVTPTQGQRMSHTYRDRGCHTHTGTEVCLFVGWLLNVPATC